MLLLFPLISGRESTASNGSSRKASSRSIDRIAEDGGPEPDDGGGGSGEQQGGAGPMSPLPEENHTSGAVTLNGHNMVIHTTNRYLIHQSMATRA